MNFKNVLEENIYNISKKVFGETVSLDHNKTVRIENAMFIETASFAGPPKKEIDVISITLETKPKIALLISCKQFTNKAEPSHVQEWSSVIQTMNKYSKDINYLGIVICPNGFTKGCESWATSSNIALIPPLKGIELNYNNKTILQMFERALTGLSKRIKFSTNDLFIAPNFYDIFYDLTSDFEGFISSDICKKYKLTNTHWQSSFCELINIMLNKKIIGIYPNPEFIQLNFNDNLIFRYFKDNCIEYGQNDNTKLENDYIPQCKKDFLKSELAYGEFIKETIGKEVTSAADFGEHFEFGINREFNLGFFPGYILNINKFFEMESSQSKNVEKNYLNQHNSP